MIIRYNGILIPDAIVEENYSKERFEELKKLKVKKLKTIKEMRIKPLKRIMIGTKPNGELDVIETDENEDDMLVVEER